MQAINKQLLSSSKSFETILSECALQMLNDSEALVYMVPYQFGQIIANISIT